MMVPYIIGVTGGIGTGKSSVSRLLSSYTNAPLIDIDSCCRDLLKKQNAGWQVLREVFGPSLFDQDGELDRSALRELIFNDDQVRSRVDALLHPLARKQMQAEVKGLGAPMVFVEIPLLYEAGWQDDVGLSVVVYADTEIQYERIMRRDDVTLEAAMAAVSSQMDILKKLTLADYAIDNSGHWSETRDRVVAVAQEIENSAPETTFSKK